MNVKYKPRPRTKRGGPSFPELALGLLIVAVAVTSALLIFVFPVPGLVKANSSTIPVVPVAQDNSATSPPVAESSVVSAPQVTVTPPANLPPGSVFVPTSKQPLTIDKTLINGIKLVLVEGGSLSTRRSPIRQEVQDFVREAGAVAGLNGTFFQNASLLGTDNHLIGPSLCDNETTETNSPSDTKPVLEGRPLVLVSPSSVCFVPYDTVTMSVPGAIPSMFPGVTNAFLGGVWLVHDGTASTREQMAHYRVHDSEDPRRRAFFAIMPDGRPVLGATDCSERSSALAAALAIAGVKEAVLLDSGFSTSLVFQQTVLVTGHSTRSIPSRPVPHALILYGQPDPSAISQIQQAPPTS